MNEASMNLARCAKAYVDKPAQREFVALKRAAEQFAETTLRPDLKPVGRPKDVSTEGDA